MDLQADIERREIFCIACLFDVRTKQDGGVVISNVQSIRVPSHFLHFNDLFLILTLSNELIERDRDFDFVHFVLKIERGIGFVYLLYAHLSTYLRGFLGDFLLLLLLLGFILGYVV
jgi:hypothetical protein